MELPPSELVEQAQILQERSNQMTSMLLAKSGVPAETKEIPQIITSLRTALVAARDFHNQRRQLGVFAEESDLGKRLTAAAARPTVVSIHDVAKLKQTRLSSRTYENLKRACNRWKAIIGEDTLESITSSHLNFFARDLHDPKENGGYGYCVENANNDGMRIRSLIKFHNEHQKEDADRIPEPSWERIKESKAQQKDRTRKDKDKATKKDVVKLLLDYSYTTHQDKYAWLFVLLLDNTTLRNTEALSLKWRNVVQCDGIWFLDVQDSKTAAGIRRIPLNTRLLNYMLPLKGADDEYIKIGRAHV